MVKKIITGIIALLILVGAGGAVYYFMFMKKAPLSDVTTIDVDGAYTTEEVLKNVVITASSVDLRNKSVEGTIVIKSDGAQDVFLRNVAVSGDIIIEEANEEYTLVLSNVSCRNIQIDSKVPVNVKLMDSSAVDTVYTNNSIKVSEKLSPRANGVDNIVIKVPKGSSEETPIISDVSLVGTGLNSLELDTPTNVNIDGDSIVENVNVNGKSNLVNVGDIGLLTANADTVYLNKPTQIVSKEGVIVLSSDEVAENSKTTAPTTTKKPPKTSASSEEITTAPAVTTTTKKVTTTTTKKPVTGTTKPPVTTIDPSINQAPVISVTDLTVALGGKVNALSGVSIKDHEDGTIKVSEANISSNNVNTSIAGVYQIIYTYTDKGGLTTNMSRKVTVNGDSAKLSAPSMINYTFDDRGDMILNWSAVGGAYDYTVLLNNKPIVVSTKETTANVSAYLNLSKDNVLGVVAYPSPTSSLTSSVPAILTYTYKSGTANAPSKFHVGQSDNIDFEFEPLFVNIRSTNRVRIIVERYENRGYVPASGVKIGTKTTTTEGEVIIGNYARSGMSIATSFKATGAYRLTFYLENGQGPSIKIEKIVDVFNLDGSMDNSVYESAIDDFQIIFSNKRWKIYLEYVLGDSLDLTEVGNDIRLDFYYGESGKAEDGKITLDYDDLGFNRSKSSSKSLINANKPNYIDFMAKDDYEGVDVFDDLFWKLYDENKDNQLTMHAELVITRNKKEEIIKTKSYWFSE